MTESKYQTFWPRFWAGMVDGLLFSPLSFVNSWIYANITSATLLAIWFVAYSAAFLVYSVLLHGKYGQTIGKMLTRVRVLDVSESKLSMWQALLRDSIPIGLALVGIVLDLPMVLKGKNPYQGPAFSLWTWILLYASLAWFLAELVTMLTNNKRRALHDFIAGSVVIRLR